MNTVFIYALVDPDTGHVRYIGWTKDLNRRLRKHLEKTNKHSHKIHWIESLKRRGLTPLQFLVAEVPKEDLAKWEIFYIRRARELGFDLVNGSDGGEGGVNPTEEVREKLRASKTGEKNPAFGHPSWNKGIPHSLETREKISARLTGGHLSEETRRRQSEARLGSKNPNFGKPRPPEVLEKLRAANTGRKMSPETCAKLSAAKSGDKHWAFGKKSSPETCEKIRLSWIRRRAEKDATAGA